MMGNNYLEQSRIGRQWRSLKEQRDKKMAKAPTGWKIGSTSVVQYDHHMAISFSGQTFPKIYQLHSMFLAEHSLVQQSLEHAESRHKRDADTTPLSACGTDC